MLFCHCVVASSGKIEKEKKQLAKDAGFVKTEVSGAEVRAQCVTPSVRLSNDEERSHFGRHFQHIAVFASCCLDISGSGTKSVGWIHSPGTNRQEHLSHPL